jgi:glutamyl-tRNA synthetase/glutamyl-Q tRNA(Asp) synthetase
VPQLPSPPWRTRFAPAPTGYLHLGHVVNAIYVWGLARAFGGRVVLRVEDHDRIRSRPEYEAALLDDLDWLGFEPDEGATADFRRGPLSLRQSDNGERYAAALDRLDHAGLVYPCTCTRRQIAERVGTPERGEELRYPGTCRQRHVDPATTAVRRVVLERREVRFTDLGLGKQVQVPAEQCGDLVARDREGNWSYQLAVVVDDFEQGVDVVIRGADLLDSTGRQIQLAALLGRAEPPRYLHHPLILREDGFKLSKSDGDSGVRELRAGGWSRERVLGEAAARVGLLDAPRPVEVDELPELFRHCG